MTVYSYIAKDKDGQEIRSSLESSNRLDALESLRKKGLTVVDLFGIEDSDAEAVQTAVKLGGKRKFKLSAKVKLGDTAIFCRQLAISINAGVPLRDALESIALDLEHPVLRHTVNDLVKKLHDGKSFSEAVADHAKIFNAMFCGLIKVAEESGKLPETLHQLATYLERTDRLQRRIKSMAAYPSFVAVFFVIVCLVMTLFILPQFTDIFSGFGSDLPMFTQVVFSINQFFVDNILWLFLGLVALISTVVILGRTRTGAYRKDKIKLKVPFVGGCLHKYILARFCRSLSIMVYSGVPISRALEICSEATGNRVLEKSVLEVRDKIIKGNGVAYSLGQSGEFPRLVVRMVGVGEDSGKLPEVLENVSDVYEDQVEVSIMTSMALFEPVVIVVFGAFILILVLAIYLPVFSVSMNVR